MRELIEYGQSNVNHHTDYRKQPNSAFVTEAISFSLCIVMGGYCIRQFIKKIDRGYYQDGMVWVNYFSPLQVKIIADLEVFRINPP
jgi:hypothetical protein